MVRIAIIVLFIGVVLTNAEEELYTDKYDTSDNLSILNNEQLYQQYFKCYMDQGPCITEHQKFMKEIFSEALQTNCNKCSEKQKVIMKKITDWFTQTKPDDWKLIMEKSVEDMKKKSAGK